MLFLLSSPPRGLMRQIGSRDAGHPPMAQPGPNRPYPVTQALGWLASSSGATSSRMAPACARPAEHIADECELRLVGTLEVHHRGYGGSVMFEGRRKAPGWTALPRAEVRPDAGPRSRIPV